MRKKSIRLVSAALAACMMASTLPVGAFALEVGTGDAVAAVSEQKVVDLQGGEIINDTFVETNGTVYTLSGDYTQGITIETTKNITINVDGKVTINNVDTFLNITGSGMVTINGTKDGVDQEIENKTADWGYTIKMAENTNVVCNGGNYKNSGMYSGSGHRGESPDMFYSFGTLELRNVTAEVAGCSPTITAFGNLTIAGGTFKAGSKLIVNEYSSYEALQCVGAVCNIDGATFETKGERAARLYGGVDATISGSTLRSGYECLEVSGGTVAVENCTLEYMGDKGGSGAFLHMYTNGYTGGQDSNVTIRNSTCLGSAETGFSADYFAFLDDPGAVYLTLENITVKGCEKAISIDYDPKHDHEKPNITIKNVTFEDNETDIYLENDENTPANAPHVELDESTKDTAGAITVEVENPANGVQITTKNTGKDYQQNLKLTSKNDGWLIGYKKDADGEYRYLTQRKVDKYFGLNTINATAMIGEGDNAITLEPYAQVKEDTEVTLTANILEGKQFSHWKAEKVTADRVEDVSSLIVADSENPETATLTMPDYDIFVTAEYEDVIVDPGTGDDDYGGDIAAGVVIGGIAAVGAYEVGTGLYRITQMDDVAMPTNRLALAKLLWERAGKPEPESTALYSDISAEDTDAQKAARWAVEQELLNDAEDGKFHPAFPVSKLRVCLTWEKAKQKGLFDQNTEA